MDLSQNLSTIPTTFYGVIGAFIIVVGYCFLQIMKSHRDQVKEMMENMREKDEHYTSFVQENNHQKTEIFDKMLIAYQDNTKKNAEFTSAIQEHTRTLENTNKVMDVVIQKLK